MSRITALCVGLLLACLLASPVEAAVQAGVAAAVRGSVSVVRTGQAERPVRNGDAIFVGDQVKTGADGLLQILLMDETVFTAGPASALTIDDFVYTPASAKGKVDATLAKGVFRFISGRIAARDPDAVKLKIPAGTIGIRGTIVLLRVRPAPDETFVILSGPGAANNAAAPTGNIRLRVGDRVYEIARTGFGMQLGGLGTVISKPFKVPQEWYDEFAFDAVTLELDDDSGDALPLGPGDDAGSEEDRAGQTTAEGELDSTEQNGVLRDLGSFEDVVADGPIESLLTTDNLTSLLELATLAGTFQGIFFFDAPDTPLNGGSGKVDLFFNLDFRTEKLNFQLSQLLSTTLGTTGGAPLNRSLPFSAGLDGSAVFQSTFQYTEMSSGCGGGCPANIAIRLFNLNGQIAGSLDADVVISNGTAAESASVRGIPAFVPSGL